MDVILTLPFKGDEDLHDQASSRSIRPEGTSLIPFIVRIPVLVMNLKESGNLVVFDASGSVRVWLNKLKI